MDLLPRCIEVNPSGLGQYWVGKGELETSSLLNDKKKGDVNPPSC